jgi:hypothetical protein
VLCASEVPAQAVLEAELLAPKAIAREGQLVTLTMRVTNTGDATAFDVAPADVESIGGGLLALWEWPRPAAAVIEPGESRDFTLKLRAMLAGEVEVVGRATGGDGGASASPLVDSPALRILPKPTARVAPTDVQGEAVLKLGKSLVPLRLLDRESGQGIAGLVVAGAPLKRQGSRALLVVADAAERYPLQLVPWCPSERQRTRQDRRGEA